MAKKKAKKAAKKSSKKAAKKPAKKAAKKVVKKAAPKKAAKKPAKKAAPRKAAPKMSAMASAPTSIVSTPSAMPVMTPTPMSIPASEPNILDDGGDDHEADDDGGEDDASMDFDDDSDDPDIRQRPEAVTASAPRLPTLGKAAPDFSLADAKGAPHKLSGYRGRWLVIYFYPKDDTPGCTVEACGIRDAYGRFGELDAAVVGVSPDSPESHAQFAAKFDLPFSLLADEDHAVCSKYGVWREKERDGVKYWGVARTTFVIDPKGRIAHVFESVNPEGHAQEIAEWLRAKTTAGAQLTLPY